VVFNRVGSERHGTILRDACAQSVAEIPVLGCLPRTPGLELPERHLGLVQAGEHKDLEGFLERAGAWVAEHLDVDGLVALARPLALSGGPPYPSLPPMAPLGQRIAVAADPAFTFSYPLVIDGWRDAGAEVVPFSPLAGEGPDGDADAVYLPGGYPELHAGALAAASGFMDGLASATARGAVVFGECGGYMVLGRGLIDADGTRHAMAGLLALETSFAKPKLYLGYRRVVTVDGGTLGKAGTAFRGHEFHYAEVIKEGPGEPLFHAAGAEAQDLGPAGLVDGQVCGSFIHLIDRE
jgi:cobyrinic acid a,c-diamide synthase